MTQVSCTIRVNIKADIHTWNATTAQQSPHCLWNPSKTDRGLWKALAVEKQHTIDALAVWQSVY